jgi:hypothetical protein
MNIEGENSCSGRISYVLYTDRIHQKPGLEQGPKVITLTDQGTLFCFPERHMA